jgi:hypothetical protein
MTGLLYRPDFDAVRDRLTTWWNGGDIGRAAMIIWAKRPTPLEEVPPMPKPEGWLTHYSTSNFDYRIYQAKTWCAKTHYLVDAVPNVSPDLAPNCLALYLGCKGIDQPGTVWVEKCIESPEKARFEYDENNFYWQFTLRLAREHLRLGQGKFLTSFPDLIEGLDTLAAMRGTEELLFDMIERQDWVHASLDKITKLYFRYYDPLYEMIKDDRGGTYWWCWAPGRFAKLQCDTSAMFSPDMFKEFMVPVLEEMCGRLDYVMYHWDGPGALPHHDHILSIKGIDIVQWTPGAGTEPIMDSRWWPYYHKTIDAGKKVALLGFTGNENLVAFRKEFGEKLKQFLIGMRVETPQQADEVLKIVTF